MTYNVQLHKDMKNYDKHMQLHDCLEMGGNVTVLDSNNNYAKCIVTHVDGDTVHMESKTQKFVQNIDAIIIFTH